MKLSILIALFLMLGGAAILLNVFFKIQFPVMRVGIALFLIFSGINLLFRWSHKGFWRGERTSAFDSAEFHPTDLQNREFNVVFGRGLLDVTSLQANQGGRIKLNIVFSEGVVRFDPNLPLRVEATGAFSETRMPDGKRMSFGESTYKSKDEPGLTLEISTVFGTTRFEEVAPKLLPLSQRAAIPH